MRMRLFRSALRRWKDRPEAGMSTAEYAVGTIAACAFAALLLGIIQSGGIESLVTQIIQAALSVAL